MKPKILFACALLALLLAVPGAAHAHAHLRKSSPAQGDTVRVGVNEIRVWFTEAVDARYTTATLLDATGHEVALGTLEPVGASPSAEYVLKLSRPLMAGAFTVKWKAAGSDGHAVTGVFDFTVEVPEAIKDLRVQTPAGGVTTQDEHAGHDMAESTSTSIPPRYRPESSTSWILARWLDFLALMLIVGSVAFRFLVAERRRHELGDPLLASIDDGVRRVAISAAIVCLVANGLRLWLQSGSLNGPERMWQSGLLTQMVLHTGWGKAWLVQTAAAIGYLVTVVIKTEDRLDSWFSATAFAVVAAATPAFSGHAAAVQQMAIVPMLDDAVHVIAASSWLGTLTLLMFVGLPCAIRSENGFARAALLVNTFSPIALVMAGITVFTGAMNALVQITHFSDLWTSHYGNVLLIKLGVVGLTAAFGAYNWRVLRPRLGTEEATARIRRSGTTELLSAAIIILVTAILVGTPTS